MTLPSVASEIVVGLDIGTSKVACVIANISKHDIEVIGFGEAESKGLKKGVVVNIDSTVEAIKSAVSEAEKISGHKVNSVFVGISGSHIKSFNSHGMVAIKNSDVQEHDIDRVIEAAKTVAIPSDQQLFHILPQEYMIDSQGGIREPIGMSGVRFEATVHMITGSLSAAKNIEKCVNQCGLTLNNIILEQLASSEAVLTEDEKNLGVCLVDIGGGTTDIAVFQKGSICHTSSIPAAGDQVTNDIAVALRTPTASAEEIKLKHACALSQLVVQDKDIQVESVGDRPARYLSKRTLVEVIEPRFSELFELIHKDLVSNDLDKNIPAGIVLTGGSSLVQGVVELAEEVMHVPVRLGFPVQLKGLDKEVNSPKFATTIGLLKYAQEHQHFRSAEADPEIVEDNKSSKGSMFSRMKRWFSQNY
jgi:cell division protein FtsA